MTTFTLTPLGISAALPAYGRHFSALTLEHPRSGDTLLFDCGEGTQFQLARSHVKPSRLRACFITHLHGDHVFGVPGLINSLALSQPDRAPFLLVGPAGLRAFIDSLPGTGRWPYDLTINELEPDTKHAVVYETPHYRVEARPLDHGVPCFGYRFAEADRPGPLDAEKAQALGVPSGPDLGRLKHGEPITTPEGRVVHPEDVVGPAQRGKAFAYVTDTRPCTNGVLLAHDAAAMYHEATYRDEHAQLAQERGHSTAAQAAQVACEANASLLLLGHFSARYPHAELTHLRAEASRIHQNTATAEELKPVLV
ncbi:MAG: ribonuclease Z [Rhodothermales bacterium]